MVVDHGNRGGLMQELEELQIRENTQRERRGGEHIASARTAAGRWLERRSLRASPLEVYQLTSRIRESGNIRESSSIERGPGEMG